MFSSYRESIIAIGICVLWWNTVYKILSIFELALGRTQLLVYKADVFRWHGQKPASYMYVISCSPKGFIRNFSNRWKIFNWNLSSSKTFTVKPSLIRRTPSGKLLGALLIQTCVIWFLVEPICRKKTLKVFCQQYILYPE